MLIVLNTVCSLSRKYVICSLDLAVEYSNALRFILILSQKQINAMNPDQTADWDTYCLQYKSPKYISKIERADDNSQESSENWLNNF